LTSAGREGAALSVDLGRRVAVVHRPGLTHFALSPFAPPNPVHAAVEALFAALGLDRGRLGHPEWNPLGDVIARGDRVIVKPNLVSSKNLNEKIIGEKLEASSTHGSLLRPILEYALKAAGPTGKVTVVDTPVEGCEIEKIVRPLGIRDVVADLQKRHSNVSFLDMRYFRVAPVMALDDVRRFGRSWNLGLLVRTKLPGDPLGYRIVDVGERSFFAGRAVPDRELAFHRSHRHTPVAHHTRGRHEYGMPNTVLDADVVINVPKMKTHKKTGVTLSLKSVIGLSSEKYWLPHFTNGDPSRGGDEFDRVQRLGERLENRLSRLPLPGDHSLIARAPRIAAPPKVIDGGWEGNDTLWRTILDLNLVLFYARRDGTIAPEPQRRYFTIVDGIVGGEGEGPLGATPVRAGLLVGGFDPVLVDYEAARCMGFSPERIPQIERALDAGLLPTNVVDQIERTVDGPFPRRSFQPPRSWPSLLGEAKGRAA
jgi:uncharacterized protein (DUF362 family)